MDLQGVCSFTGHRKIPTAQLASLEAKLAEIVTLLYTRGVRDFYTGGAMGFDRMAARTVLALKKTYPHVRLHLLLPCRGQDAGWQAKEKAAYERECKAADEVTYLADQYYEGCMQVRNQALVDHAHIMVAFVTNPRSGAGQTVRMAKAKGVPVINLAELL